MMDLHAHLRRVVTAVVALICACSLAATFFIAVTSPTHAAPETDTADKPLEIEIAAPPSVAPDAQLDLTVTITNASDHAAELSSVRINGTRYTLSTQTALYDWMSGEARPISALATQEPHNLSLASGASTTLTFSISPTDRAWPDGHYEWGVRGLEAIVDGRMDGVDIEATDRTVTVGASSAELPAFPVSAAIVCQASLSDDDAIDPFATLTGETNTAPSTTLDLNKWDTAGVNILWDPLTSDRPELTKAAAFTLPAYQADVASLALDHQHSLAEQLVAMRTDRLTELKITNASGYAPMSEAFSQTAGEFLEAHDFGTAIIPSSFVNQRTATSFFPDAQGSIVSDSANYRALIAHASLSSTLMGDLHSPISTNTIELSNTDATAVAVAQSALFYTDAPSISRSLVTMVTAPCGQQGDNTSDSDILSRITALLASPWLTPTALSDLPQQTSSSEWEPADSGQSLYDAHLYSTLTTFLASSASLVDALPAEHQQTFTADAQRAAYDLLHPTWRTDINARSAYARSLDVQDFLDEHLSIHAAQHISIVSDNANLPLTIHSDLAIPVTVIPQLAIPDGRLKQTQAPSVIVNADGNTQLRIPVDVLGSGRIVVTARVKVASHSIDASAPISVRLHANWETRGTAILALITLLILAIGITRSIRAGRRSRPISNSEFTEGLQNARIDHGSAQ